MGGKMVKLDLVKVRRGIYETNHNGQYIDFFKLPTDGLWRSSFFNDWDRQYLTLRVAKMAVELELSK